jgi:outer membrane protein OmpA-like peptidoglycan-associated protein
VLIEILGYADYLHTDNYNLKLSQRRADAIKNYLLSKNFSGEKITGSYGIGERKSKASNSREGDPFYRRVDIIITSTTIIASAKKTEEVKKDSAIEKPEPTDKKIEELKEGESISIEGLNFEPGRHFITKASVPVLQKLVKTLQQYPKLKIEIQGHVCCTDGEGDGFDYDTKDRKLSENRARMIYEYLISKGISKNRLSYKGYGHSRPKFPDESTPEEEQANRRVEILVIEK